MSLVELMFLLLCFPVSWGFGWVMARRWAQVRWTLELDQVTVQMKELRKGMAHLENLMKEIEKDLEQAK